MPKVDWKGDALAKLAEEACIEVARMTAETVKGAEISFNTPQAAWLHESQNYTPSHAGTGPDYLRGPLLENESKYHEDIAAALKAIWG